MNDNTAIAMPRRCKNRFPVNLGLRVSHAVKPESDTLADALDEDVAGIVRQTLEAGLPVLTQRETGRSSAPVLLSGDTGTESSSEDKIRQWRRGMTVRERKDRVWPHLILGTLDDQ